MADRFRKEIYMSRKKQGVSVLIPLTVALCCMLAGCGNTGQIDDNAAVPANAPAGNGNILENSVPAETEAETTIPEEPTATDTNIHVVAVGDNLVQQFVYQSAQNHSADGVSFNFDYCYENIKPLIHGDINMINQETLICGEGFEISGSNFNFNSPTALGDAVINTGFNVITMCNNHLLDKGASGLNACINYWDEKMAAHAVCTGIIWICKRFARRNSAAKQWHFSVIQKTPTVIQSLTILSWRSFIPHRKS